MAKCHQVVLDYLRSQNRPFSAGDIETNLKKENGFSRNAVVQALEELVAEDLVKEKAYGKTKIFYPTQGLEPSLPPEQVQSLNGRIATHKREAESLKKEIRELETSIAKKSAKPSGVVLRKQIQELVASVSAKEEKVEQLRGTASSVDPKEMKAQKKKIDKMLEEWRKRRALATNILDLLLENYPKSKSDLMNEVGFVTDADAGATYPTK